ncbi:MAG: hypothetical protein II798_06445 [Lachnospiraceae bacterium]|nr:hypothetical protein [Lachnospiraceae bacterium]
MTASESRTVTAHEIFNRIMVGEIKVRVAKILELIVLNLAVDTLSGIIVGKILSEIGANPDDSLMLLINGCGTLILYIMTLVMKKTGVHARDAGQEGRHASNQLGRVLNEKVTAIRLHGLCSRLCR